MSPQVSNKVLGIDLGTTYSAVAHIDETGHPQILSNRDGDQTTPSAVYFESADNVVVGMEAKNGQKVFPDDTVSLIKRIMGNRIEMDFHGNAYTPESISALILGYLADSARDALDEDDLKHVVITVPAYFGLTEKKATQTAGKIAGLEVQGIIPEPVAAALSVGIDPSNPRTVFVYDLGGGTFDCTVMDLNEEGVTVLATDGDRSLGGADWDQKLFDFVLERFVEKAGLDEDPTDSVEFVQDLLGNVEDAKKSLSKKTKTKVRCSYNSVAEMIEVTREEFEEITRELVEQTLEVSKRTLEAAKEVKPDLKIDKYLIVGGSARMPMIPAALESELGWEVTPTEYDHAVAKGAAIYGQGSMDFAIEHGSSEDEEGKKQFLLGGASGPMTISNVLSKSVGLRFVDEERKPFIGHLLKQGEPLPTTTTIQAACAQDNTTSLPVRIFEQSGERPSEYIDANTEITPEGGATFVDLPQLPKGSPINITMSIDSEGLLTLEGQEPKTGQELKLEVQVATMQEEEIEQAIQMVSKLEFNE